MTRAQFVAVYGEKAWEWLHLGWMQGYLDRGAEQEKAKADQFRSKLRQKWADED